ncbi:MAG: hypothetical protein NC433_07250 [Clostridiales bacterium]|nr:hypothetical protein [Clostridiales bacterium]
MNTKTMEGLIGARTNMNLLNTPMRVYKEARLKGDTAMMERAMGYVGEFSDKTQEYKVETDEGMKKDAEETRKIAKEQREEAIRKRREEREKLEEKIEEKIEESRNKDNDIETKEAEGCLLEISEEGKALLKDNTDSGSTDSAVVSVETNAGDVKEAVTYTNTGEIVSAKRDAGIFWKPVDIKS